MKDSGASRVPQLINTKKSQFTFTGDLFGPSACFGAGSAIPSRFKIWVARLAPVFGYRLTKVVKKRATVVRVSKHVRHQNETRHEDILRDNHCKLAMRGAYFGGDSVAATIRLRLDNAGRCNLRYTFATIRYSQSITRVCHARRPFQAHGAGRERADLNVFSEVFVNAIGDEPQDRQSFVTTPTEFGGTSDICNFERHGGERFPRNKSADCGLRQEERPYVPYM